MRSPADEHGEERLLVTCHWASEHSLPLWLVRTYEERARRAEHERALAVAQGVARRGEPPCRCVLCVHKLFV
jgi:hypothetical protein